MTSPPVPAVSIISCSARTFTSSTSATATSAGAAVVVPAQGNDESQCSAERVDPSEVLPGEETIDVLGGGGLLRTMRLTPLLRLPRLPHRLLDLRPGGRELGLRSFVNGLGGARLADPLTMLLEACEHHLDCLPLAPILLRALLALRELPHVALDLRQETAMSCCWALRAAGAIGAVKPAFSSCQWLPSSCARCWRRASSLMSPSIFDKNRSMSCCCELRAAGAIEAVKLT
eukprot:CAMPEP_0115756478 /NCGR_PEP_ID=MMETSP0272-20121206/97944_2 /TAXON_ID=71861 /ORGANISM="Scrippsiella trochoidea, Strain CCMP3099" /LENGTH=230 /DNA_ID=CAMNT_0003201993 /DNA_START=199 /DNA_END=887 /DNA_ORIENTATION=-